MKKSKSTVMLLCALLPFAGAMAQPGLLPAFRLHANDLELSRAARPGTYFDKAGSKFAILGFESGTFEAWAYPLKLFRNFEFAFLLGNSTRPLTGGELVRHIAVTPEATTLTFTHQSFTLRAIFITPLAEPGAIILLAVNASAPLTIVCSFLPVLQPMWPAGLGGQYARWDDGMKAYLISESSRRHHAWLGSPAATGISYTPAHMLSDQPNQFKIEIPQPAAVRGKFIPLIMAGGRGQRETIRAVYERLADHPEKYYQENYEYFRRLRATTLQIATPNRELNLAFEWAKVAYDNLRVDHPGLGKGLVAGLGVSGTSGRPGFGWFFGGDAYINSFSMNSYGAFAAVQEALAFTQKWQRRDGKMAHELSQAEGYLNWFQDYPYGYLHGDTTPFYLCAMYDYYAASGDAAFIRKSWPSLQRAFQWCLTTDANGDGLMDNRQAGLGALEFGSLTDIETDIYLAAVWVRAATVMPDLARVAGKPNFARTAARVAERAQAAFGHKFWDSARRHYAYAFNAGGEQVAEVTPWPAVGLMWQLGDPEHSAATLLKLNAAELSTDWGVRSLSNKSPLFEPLNYNYGAVWPFLTSWVATAQFQHHFALQGYNSLLTSVRHTFDNALGCVTEVFSGAQNIWPQEAVAHQGFCSAGVVLPLVRGLLGLTANTPARKISFAPHFPADWERVTIRNFRAGEASCDFDFHRGEAQLGLLVSLRNAPPCSVQFAPALGIGSRMVSVTINGRGVPFREVVSSQTIQPVVNFLLRDSASISVNFVPTVELLPPVITSNTGDHNQGLKVIAIKREGRVLSVEVEGLAGERYELEVVNPGKIINVEGAERQGRVLVIQMAAGGWGEFIRQEIRLETE
ncbi:MAG: GH116 family glycosyl hydrolase [candidate division KSB1 bacterium]|nr:GH116 family glycosyl hydrolase [candidate division KSB1 bacterium]MDZ7275716.1 GH116 family glycosyl hydrolase [candidate division KSB1 bacterium]MDZ7284593.1 GH116 family glycosyl hydrolase [candidate division KSB1 bacterium]MDZ7297988.1 GH116 family glycosyl hydrolase [candidate division KSB1 bacterium]MDZ7305844.1 GH116 family glycosyl hydrolase [candidate division KSB1 bacterium]